MQRIILFAALAATGSLRAQTIVEYRWWLNDNVGTLATANLTSAEEIELNTTLALPAVTKDYNTITLQFKDSNGAWSVPQTRLFTRSTGEVNAYAYWVDDAIANSITNSIGPNGLVDLIADLPTGVPAGTHTFTIRFRGTNGTWSVPLTTQFSSTVGITELPGISEVVLFPNPVTEALSVRVNTTEAQRLDLQLMDAQGRTVRSLPSWTASGSTYRTWDISDLAPGSYLLRISDGNGARNLPFVKP